MDFTEKERDEFCKDLMGIANGAVKLVARMGTAYIASDIVKKVMPESCGKFGKLARFTAGLYVGIAAKDIVSTAVDKEFDDIRECYEMIDGLIKKHKEEKTLKEEDNAVEAEPKEDDAEPEEEE